MVEENESRVLRRRRLVRVVTRRLSFRATLFGAGTLAGIVLGWMLANYSEGIPVRAATSPATGEDIATLRTELEQLKTLVPDQAHAMQDVGYHFGNLWFAAQHQNWPLADFYLAETRSHLKWGVRIRPVRQTKAGDIDLNGILEAVDNSLLSAVKEAIDKKDLEQFTQAYRQTLEGCYACHKASEKPFLRPQVPKTPTVHIMNLDPAAEWPQ
ncbi:MAG: hypothetical protein HY706_00985 [Candidatus Hydrogenedentes bacterium]|nr:hypothetical protein [Candidatus Hydrogenedentota bacterium]